MTEPQQPKAAPTNNQNSLDEPTNTIDNILNGLMTRYTLQSDVRKGDEIVHYLDDRAKQILSAAINKTIMEAQVEELERLKVMLAGFTWGPYDPFNIINTRIAELKKYGRADNE